MGTFLKVFAAIFMLLSFFMAFGITDNSAIGVAIIFYSFAFGFLLAGIGSVIDRLEQIRDIMKKEKADAPKD